MHKKLLVYRVNIPDNLTIEERKAYINDTRENILEQLKDTKLYDVIVIDIDDDIFISP
jgi:hypothetical protein